MVFHVKWYGGGVIIHALWYGDVIYHVMGYAGGIPILYVIR